MKQGMFAPCAPCCVDPPFWLRVQRYFEEVCIPGNLPAQAQLEFNQYAE
jgi:hypothetical protein